MGQTRIVIESTGSHHNGIPQDADKVARDTVATLQAMGHTVTKAEFQVRSFDGAGETAPSSVDNLTPGASVVELVEAAVEGVQAGVGADGEGIVAGDGAVVEGEKGDAPQS